MEDNLLISIKITNKFINKVWGIYIIKYRITLKENKSAPCMLIRNDRLQYGKIGSQDTSLNGEV